MKNFIITCVLASLLPFFVQGQQFIINGKISNAEGKTVYLNFKSKKEIDSAKVINGQFKFEGQIEGIDFIAFKLGNRRFPSAMEPGNLNITFTDDMFNQVQVSGQQVALDFRSCQLLVDFFQKRLATSRKAYQEASKKLDTTAMINLGKENNRINAERSIAVKQWTEEHLNSMICPYIIQTELKSLPAIELEKLFGKLSKDVKQSKDGKELVVFINSKRIVRTGQIAPLFSQKSSNGSDLSLESLKGNYVLLDFWASWCVPCRQENPLLTELYNLYKKRNLKIVGISLDEQKSSWLNAVQQDRMMWNQISDLKGWKNEVAVLYGIGSLPALFLLDTELKIVEINPDLALLKKKLDALLR